MAKKIKINKDACIGCGLCVSSAPDVFGFADDGKSEVVGPVTAANEASINDVMASCPVGAIVEDTDAK